MRKILLAVGAVVLLLAALILWLPGRGTVEKTYLERDNGGDALVVLLHGYTLNGDSLKGVEDTLRKIPALKNASVLRPELPLSLFSMAQPGPIVAQLLAAVDQVCAVRVKEGNPYKHILLVGHSAGALYARKMYVAACGEQESAPFEDELKGALKELKADGLTQPRPWATNVDRIILLAGMNRGWSISHHMSIPRAAYMTVGVGMAHLFEWCYGKPPFIFSIRRGAPFITELRLQWLAMRAAHPADKTLGRAPTVQLLGTIDDLVSPDDNIDLVSGSDFRYLEVPHSGHKNVIDMEESQTDPHEREACEARRRALTQAVSQSVADSTYVPPVEPSFVPNTNVTDVVFVIHGIRDEGYWTRKIAYHVQVAGNGIHRTVATVTSSYGYFPMLSFLRPGARREKVEWLMDRYTEAKAQYPNAVRFHYIGHSNGTYLLAEALKEYPAVRFDQVVFAGSVVYRKYDWETFLKENRVKKVLNFVASADWVVAFFPKAIQSVGIHDLGSAGHDGFVAARENPAVVELSQGGKPVYVVGGHGAALGESMWDAIGKFTMTGIFEIPPGAQITSKQAVLVAAPAKVAPLIWVAIVVVLLAILGVLLALPIREWKKTLLIVFYLDLIWTVLTKV